METDDKAQPNHATQDVDSDVARSPLESAESYVAGSPGTGEPGDGSSTAFSAAFSAFLEWGEARRMICHKAKAIFHFLTARQTVMATSMKRGLTSCQTVDSKPHIKIASDWLGDATDRQPHANI